MVDRKERYKMYKAGKHLVYAMVAALSLAGVMTVSNSVVHADTVHADTTTLSVNSASATATNSQVASQSVTANEKSSSQPTVVTNDKATATKEVTTPATDGTNINSASNATQQNVNKHWYLVDSTTHQNLTGFQEIKDEDKVVYYSPQNAQMQYGQHQINNHWYNFDKWSGKMSTGFTYLNDQKKTVYYSTNQANLGQMQYGWQTINGSRYYFYTNSGAMATGELHLDGHWYDFDGNGKMQTGFTKLGDRTVYYGTSQTNLGQMQYGMQTIGNDHYYFHTNNGDMAKGELQLNGHWYDFDGNGKMQTGFTKLGDRTVYYSTDQNKLGQMQYGWQVINGAKYYFATNNGDMARGGQKQIDNGWYLFNNQGQVQTGFQTIKDQNKTVYYGTDGRMQYGQQTINGKTYYFNIYTGQEAINQAAIDPKTKNIHYYDGNGVLVKGRTISLNGHNYAFDENGNLQANGLVSLGGATFYLANNQVQFGQKQLNGHWYLFDKTTGQMQTGFQSLAPYGENKTVYYGKNGQMQYGQQQISGHWYLFDRYSGAMQTGLQNLSAYGQNKTAYYANNGQMQYGAQKLNGQLYFFDQNSGAMFVNQFVNIGGQTYRANDRGILVAPKYVSQFTPIFAGWGCAVAASAMLMSIKDKTLNLMYAYSHEPQAGVFNGAGFTRVISAGNLVNYMRQFDSGFRNITGSNLGQIKQLISEGHPVLYYGYSGYDQAITWKNHCKVIVGYNNGYYHIYDPCYYGQWQGANSNGHGRYDLGADHWISEAALANEYYGNNGNGAVTIY